MCLCACLPLSKQACLAVPKHAHRTQPDPSPGPWSPRPTDCSAGGGPQAAPQPVQGSHVAFHCYYHAGRCWAFLIPLLVWLSVRLSARPLVTCCSPCLICACLSRLQCPPATFSPLLFKQNLSLLINPEKKSVTEMFTGQFISGLCFRKSGIESRASKIAHTHPQTSHSNKNWTHKVVSFLFRQSMFPFSLPPL